MDLPEPVNRKDAILRTRNGENGKASLRGRGDRCNFVRMVISMMHSCIERRTMVGIYASEETHGRTTITGDRGLHPRTA